MENSFQNNSLKNKTAIVTASSDGYVKLSNTHCPVIFIDFIAIFFRIGYAIAERLAAEGANVVISSRYSFKKYRQRNAEMPKCRFDNVML